ncbi:unnamed protein product, partial [Ectocarpus sp. 12 AP-2014]
ASLLSCLPSLCFLSHCLRTASRVRSAHERNAAALSHQLILNGAASDDLKGQQDLGDKQGVFDGLSLSLARETQSQEPPRGCRKRTVPNQGKR